MTHDDLPDMYRRCFADHVLEVLTETDRIRAYRIAKPGTSAMSATIVGGPDGVTITGDVMFGDQHVLHADCKPIGWFAAKDLSRSLDYLAKKFRVGRAWDGAFARQCAEQWAEEGEEARELDAVDWDDEHDAQMYLSETFGEPIDAPRHAQSVALLRVVQETFARLYAEHVGEMERTGRPGADA